jgi:hypothetical protein
MVFDRQSSMKKKNHHKIQMMALEHLQPFEALGPKSGDSFVWIGCK